MEFILRRRSLVIVFPKRSFTKVNVKFVIIEDDHTWGLCDSEVHLVYNVKRSVEIELNQMLLIRILWLKFHYPVEKSIHELAQR